MVIRSLTSKDGKPLEKQLMLSNINAPRLARRANPNSADGVNENDQVASGSNHRVVVVFVDCIEFVFLFEKPYAFEAREFLRRKLVGKEVCFIKDANSTTVDRGTLILGRDTATGENINDAIIAAGLAEVRRMNKPSCVPPSFPPSLRILYI